jgi:predicted nucleic acid-binding protein
VIHHLNGRPDIIQRLQALQPEGLGLSVIVLAELYEGFYSSRDPEQSEQKPNDFLERA